MDVASRAGHLQIEAKDPPPAFPRVARKGFKVLAFLILAAASAHAGASVIYDPGPLLFTTTNQSMWGTGNATVISKSVFLGPQWTNQTVTVGKIIGDVNETTVNTNPAWCPLAVIKDVERIIVSITFSFESTNFATKVLTASTEAYWKGKGVVLRA